MSSSSITELSVCQEYGYDTSIHRVRARKQTFFFIFPCSLLTKLHTRSYNFIVSEEREMKRIFLIVYTITRIFITNVRIPSGFIDCRAMIHRSSTISFLPIASNLQRITRKKKKKGIVCDDTDLINFQLRELRGYFNLRYFLSVTRSIKFPVLDSLENETSKRKKYIGLATK